VDLGSEAPFPHRVEVTLAYTTVLLGITIAVIMVPDTTIPAYTTTVALRIGDSTFYTINGASKLSSLHGNNSRRNNSRSRYNCDILLPF
jgi:hypothetical protein